MTTETPATDAPLPSRAERGTWEGRTARRPEGLSTGRGWASIIPLLFLLFSGSIQIEDRDEREGREASAGAPASPAPGLSPPAGHPAFETGVLYVEPELRDEVQAYWQAYATWERTRQGPPPQAPRVSVRVDHDEKPSAAAQLRDAMAPMGAARGGGAKRAGAKRAGEKSAGRKGAGRKSAGEEKSAGPSPWAGDEAAAAVIDKGALPSAHRPRSKGGGCGKAGGSSIEILSLGTKLVLTEVTVAVGKAGKGGDGADGQNGANGGAGASGGTASEKPPSIPGCRGGDGGRGGAGGPGGGGRGGHAVGIAYAGAPSAAVELMGFTDGTASDGGQVGLGGPPESAGAPGSAGSCWNFATGKSCGQ